MKKLTLLVALMVATGTFKAYAQLVAEYTFGTSPGTASPSYVDYVVLFSASNVNVGPGQVASFVTGNPGMSRHAQNWTTNTTTPDLVNQHFRLTLIKALSADVTVTRIDFQEARSAQGPRTFQIRTSLDGFASVSWQQTILGDPGPTVWRSWTILVNLPILPPSIEIRFYAFNGEDNGGAWRIDNVRIYGNITNLPIELLSFTGEKVDESKVRLLWSTASERDNEYFTVYRSLDMQVWQEVGTVPGTGTSQSRIDYDLVDTSPHMGTNYYRLRQTDFDGTFVDSHAISVDVDVGKTFTVFPNPTARGQPIQASKKVDLIIDGLGRAIPFDPLSIIIEVPGVYTLVHIDENGFSSTNRVIITY